MIARPRRPVSFDDQVGRGLRLLQLDVGHSDIAALVGQPQADRLPKTLCAAGDERDLIGECV